MRNFATEQIMFLRVLNEIVLNGSEIDVPFTSENSIGNKQVGVAQNMDSKPRQSKFRKVKSKLTKKKQNKLEKNEQKKSQDKKTIITQ
jgi:hypothetical protein